MSTSSICNKPILIVFVFFILGSSMTTLRAQDSFFSQFYASPMQLNPALTGVFNGKYRVAAIYRDQYRRLFDKPFVTYGLSTDLRFDLGGKRNISRDKVGAGLVFLSDRMGKYDYAYNQIGLAGSYHKSLSNINKSTYLTVGLMVGIKQKTINFGSLSLSDQFNGITGYTLPSNDRLPENNIAFSDFSLGINFTTSPYKGLNVFAGAALLHIFEPNVSFYANDDDESNLEPFSNVLPRTYSANFAIRFAVSDPFQIMPRAMAQLQSEIFRSDLGISWRFLLSDYNGFAIQLGTYGRLLGDSEDAFHFDSAIMSVGFEYENVLLGFSYDWNVSNHSFRGIRQRSAFEISLAYLGDYDSELVLCPKF